MIGETQDATPDIERVQAGLLQFLQENTGRTWDVDDDLFASGGVSSLFAMRLVVHLEQAFGTRVDGADLTLDNFRTVRAMAALVERLRTSAAMDS